MCAQSNNPLKKEEKNSNIKKKLDVQLENIANKIIGTKTLMRAELIYPQFLVWAYKLDDLISTYTRDQKDNDFNLNYSMLLERFRFADEDDLLYFAVIAKQLQNKFRTEYKLKPIEHILLAKAYEIGCGVTNNLVKATMHFNLAEEFLEKEDARVFFEIGNVEKAYNLGLAEAALALAKKEKEGSSKQRKYLKEAGEKGCGEGYMLLAKQTQDVNEKKIYLEKAAQLYNLEALCELSLSNEEPIPPFTRRFCQAAAKFSQEPWNRFLSTWPSDEIIFNELMKYIPQICAINAVEGIYIDSDNEIDDNEQNKEQINKLQQECLAVTKARLLIAALSNKFDFYCFLYQYHSTALKEYPESFNIICDRYPGLGWERFALQNIFVNHPDIAAYLCLKYDNGDLDRLLELFETLNKEQIQREGLYNHQNNSHFFNNDPHFIELKQSIDAVLKESFPNSAFQNSAFPNTRSTTKILEIAQKVGAALNPRIKQNILTEMENIKHANQEIQEMTGLSRGPASIVSDYAFPDRSLCSFFEKKASYESKKDKKSETMQEQKKNKEP